MVVGGSRRLSVLVPLAVVSVLLSACGQSASGSEPSTSAPASLEGTSWILATYAGPGGASTPAEAEPVATLAFAAASRLSGSTGCNSFGGQWVEDGDALTLAVGAITKKACQGPLSAQETFVLADLERVTTFSLVSGALRLSAADGAELMSYLPGVSGLSGLAGTTWAATGVNNGTGAVASVPSGVVITADFAADGTLSGSSGCNAYSTTWTTSGADGLELGPVAGTTKACEGAAGTTESQYLAALDEVGTYTIDGRTLTLRDKDGAAQVTYELA